MNLSRCPAVVLIVFLLAACAACSEARLPSGSWISRRAVAQDFEQARVFPDHTYYYIGSVSQPDGVIAMDQRFRLREGKVWAQIDMDEARMRGWQQWWRADAFHRCRYLGGLILLPDGQQAGYWYSPFLHNIVKVTENGELIIHRPHSASGATDCEGDSDMNSRFLTR